jgi:3-hydroxymyristoyl/3-hydroxydecanoyl-(acyl carrier protein) dehydratase
MIDRVISVNKEQKSILCTTQVPESSSILDAHFPGFRILPGVFMIEMIAQAAGLLFVGLEGFKKMPILFGVEHTRFRQMAQPGDVLTVEVGLTHYGSGYIVCNGEIHANAVHIAKAEVRLKLVDVPTLAAEQLLRERYLNAQLSL